MFLFESQLFYYRLVVLTELIIIELLFSFRYKKRNYFIFRCIGSFVFVYGLAFLFPIFSFDALYTSFMFLCIYGFTIIALYFMYDEPFLKILFCSLVSYTIRHIANSIYSLCLPIFGYGLNNDQYGPQAGQFEYDIFTAIIYFDSYFITYWLAYLFMSKYVNKRDEIVLNNIILLIASFVILMIDIVLNALVTYKIDNKSDSTLIIICYIYNLISAFFSLFLLLLLIRNKSLNIENETIKALWNEKKSQYELSKENIDLINMKCHDLKHQIRKIGSNKIDESTLKEIENSINIFDLRASTDNEELDIMLTEKSLICKKENIKLTYICDGKSLEFISSGDIYSLFGNLLDNAIEAVRKLDKDNLRNISLKVRKVNNFVSISIQNFFDSRALNYKNGMPQSTKKDKLNHGFGLKSIKYIVNKYDGNMTIETKGNVFLINILIPIK